MRASPRIPALCAGLLLADAGRDVANTRMVASPQSMSALEHELQQTLTLTRDTRD